jgi:hypothetical protein
MDESGADGRGLGIEPATHAAHASIAAISQGTLEARANPRER